jgi:hypothetical protein
MLVATRRTLPAYRTAERSARCSAWSSAAAGSAATAWPAALARRRRDHEYTSLVEDTRRQAIDRLVMNAKLMGADAVVMMRFDSGSIGQTMNEVVAYGTAVKLAPA